MGGTESNCCGSRPRLQIPVPEDPDSGIIGRKRRFQNIDAPQLSPQQSNSFSQHSFYDTLHHQTHRFHITGNITVSSNTTDGLNSPLPCGITVNINPLSENDNKNTKNTFVYNPNNNTKIKSNEHISPITPIKHQKTPIIELKNPIINGLINVKNNENTINYNNNYTNNWIENYNREHNEDSADDIDTLKNTSNECKTEEEEDDTESVISYLSNAPDSDEINKQWLENENKYKNTYDLDCMETLELKDNKNGNDMKVRRVSAGNLFNVDDIQNWNRNDMEQLEMEMLREMRRLSAKSLPQHTNNIQYVNINNVNNN